MLSNSESESDEEFFSGIHRCSDSSDDDSGPIDDIAYESYDDGFDNVTIPDPVDSDLWIEQWDFREEEEHFSHGHSNACSTSGENSDIEVVMYYDSGDESIISSSDSSNEDMPVVQYHSASSNSVLSKDSIDMNDGSMRYMMMMKLIVGKIVSHSVRSTILMWGQLNSHGQGI